MLPFTLPHRYHYAPSEVHKTKIAPTLFAGKRARNILKSLMISLPCPVASSIFRIQFVLRFAIQEMHYLHQIAQPSIRVITEARTRWARAFDVLGRAVEGIHLQMT